MQRVLCASAVVMLAVSSLLGRGNAVVQSRPTQPPDVLYAMPGDLNYAYGPQGVVLQDVIDHAPGAPFQRRVVQWGLPGDIPVSRNSPR
jgi:hypothetical protein